MIPLFGVLCLALGCQEDDDWCDVIDAANEVERRCEGSDYAACTSPLPLHDCDTGLAEELIESLDAMSCGHYEWYVDCVDSRFPTKGWTRCYAPYQEMLETCTDDSLPAD